MLLDPVLLATHGALLASIASAVIMGSLWLNPRLFLRHFPAAVRQSQAPLTREERRVGRVVAIVLLCLFVGVPTWSATVFAEQRGAGPASLFVHAFLVGMVANVTDWLLLDELWLGLGRPRWALPPGVRQEDVVFDHRQHARAFASGTVVFLAVAALATLMAWLSAA
jgi:hypothetical protein